MALFYLEQRKDCQLGDVATKSIGHIAVGLDCGYLPLLSVVFRNAMHTAAV